MKNIFVDTDIILDLLTKRDPFYIHSAHLFHLIDSGILNASVSSLIFSNLFYILRKQKSKKETIEILNKFKLLVNILSVDEKIINSSLSSNFPDFEDAIQYYTAKANNIDYIITRNIKDYKNFDIQALSADQFINIFKKTKK